MVFQGESSTEMENGEVVYLPFQFQGLHPTMVLQLNVRLALWPARPIRLAQPSDRFPQPGMFDTYL